MGFRVLIACCLLAGTTAQADVFDDCSKAVAAQDVAAAKEAAWALLSGRGTVVPEDQVDAIAECLELGWLVPHGYSKLQKKFVPLVQSQIENRKFESLKAAREAQEAADRVAQLVAEAEAEQERRRLRRVQEVTAKLIEVCENQYRKKPDETILNKMCFDVFMARGLPK